MERHLLVTISEDKSALHGIRFVASFFQAKENVRLTLFYTTSQPMTGEIVGFAEKAERERLQHAREARAQQALDQAVKTLVDLGFPAENIEARLKFRKYTKGLDIINEAEQGLYDAVVLGRRGLTALEELVETSVSRELLTTRFGSPIWICRMPETGRRNVLLCVDDSEQAMRMADHVGYILANEPSHTVTLMNVFDPGSGDRPFAEALFAKARELLHDNGVADARIETRMVEAYNAPAAIMERSRDYAAVAVGRTGQSHGFLKRLFMGSVSTVLFRQLTGAALWLQH